MNTQPNIHHLCTFINPKDARYLKLMEAYKSLDEAQLKAVALYLLTGIDPKYAEPWKYFYGVEHERRSMSRIVGVIPELNGRKALAIYRVKHANDLLSMAVRREAFYKFLNTGRMPSEGPERPLFFLDLPVPVLNALTDKGIFTIGSLSWSNDHFVRNRIPRIGELRFQEISERLERAGSSFAA